MLGPDASVGFSESAADAIVLLYMSASCVMLGDILVGDELTFAFASAAYGCGNSGANDDVITFMGASEIIGVFIAVAVAVAVNGDADDADATGTIVGTTGNPSKPVFVKISPRCNVSAT